MNPQTTSIIIEIHVRFAILFHIDSLTLHLFDSQMILVGRLASLINDFPFSFSLFLIDVIILTASEYSKVIKADFGLVIASGLLARYECIRSSINFY